MANNHWFAVVSAVSLGALAACSSSTSTLQQADGSISTSISETSAYDVRASVFSSSSQAHAALAAGADGRLMVAWDSRRQEGGTYGVFARSFDAAGNALSHELHINQTVAGMQHKPSVAIGADGSAWFAWESHGQDGSGSSVVARKFELQNGEYVAASAEIPVNTQRQDDQTSPVLAANTQGDVLAVFANQIDEDVQGPARFGLRARLLSAANDSCTTSCQSESKLAPEQIISQVAIGSDTLPSLTALADGSFLVTWARSHADQQSGIYARHLNADGTALGSEFRLSTNISAIEPSIDALASGEFVAAWLVEDQGGYAIECARFDAIGKQLDLQTIATPADGWKSGVAVSAAPDGRYLVAFNTERPSDVAGQPGGVDRDIQIHRFHANGVLLSKENGSAASAGRQILTAATGVRRVLWTEQDSVALAWDGDAGLGDSSAVHLSLHPTRKPDLQEIPGSEWSASVADMSDLGEPKAAIIDFGKEILAANPPIWDPNWQPQDRLMLPATSGDFGFEAVPGTGWTPPDPEMAIGPDRIMVIVNGRIAAFDRNGNEQWGTKIESNGFWGNQGATGFVFDPEVCWDPHSERFMAMACERSTTNRSMFLFAVSKDNSPNDANDWHKYRMDVTSLAGSDIDSPNMSLSRDTVLLTADFFSPTDKYLLYLIDKSSVLNGGAAVTTSELISGAKQQSMGIPVVYDNTDTLYIAQTTENSNNTTVILHAITNPFTSYNRVTTTVAVEPYTYPSHPPQKGSSIKPYLFEPRFWSCAQANGSIWAVHHVDNTRSRARWYEFDLNGWPNTGTPSVHQWGEINLGGGIYTFFPSIAVDADNNAAITYARSASNEYISIGRAVRAAADPLGEFRPGQVVKTSANAHTSGRWGDYSGTQPDPLNPGTFWGHHEWTNGSSGSWRTWVARYEIQPSAFELTETTLTAGTTTVLETTGAPAGSKVYFIYTLTGKGLYEVPQLSTTFSLENPVLIGSATADASGNATVSKFVPAAAQGMDVWIQAGRYGMVTNLFKATVQ